MTGDPRSSGEMFDFVRAKLFGGGLASITGSANVTMGDEILGVVMEVGKPRGTALVFGLRDGSARLLTSTGGGSSEGQGLPPINAAAKKLVKAGEALVGSLPVVNEHPVPAVGEVRFSIVTPSGVHAADALERDLLAGHSNLQPLFLAASEILAGFRLVDERGRPNESLYLNCLLMALARGKVASVVLTSGMPPPDPAALTTDAEDLAWFAFVGLALEVQSTEEIIDLIRKAAGFGLLTFGKKEGNIRTSLASSDGTSSSIFNFRVTTRKVEGRIQAEIAPIRGAS